MFDRIKIILDVILSRIAQGLNPFVLKLIIPTSESDNEPEKWGGHFTSLLYGERKYSAMGSAVPVLSGLTPRSIRVSVQDENIEQIDFEEKVDLVGITSYTSSVKRAYEIADEFRKRNVTVVMGGVHVSMCQEEALQHADCIVIGEAEDIWKDVLRDYKNRRLKKTYKSESRPDLNKQPFPRYEVECKSHYYMHVIQTTRGCFNKCDFCSVNTLYGARIRYKSVQRIIEEVKALNRLNKKMIHFADDAFTSDRKRTKELLKKLIHCNITYTVQTTIDIYEDDELLDLLRASGCLGVVIGFDSLNELNLKQVHKGAEYKVENYPAAIKKIQSKGILMCGSFIFGFDNDDCTVFERTVNFIKESGMGNCVVNILTPLPGTPLFLQLQKEGRLLHANWPLYDFHHVCFKPKNMTVENLQNGYYWALQELFSLDVVYDRLISLYSLWNKNGVRRYERVSPLIVNLSMHYVSKFFTKVKHPPKLNQ